MEGDPLRARHETPRTTEHFDRARANPNHRVRSAGAHMAAVGTAERSNASPEGPCGTTVRSTPRGHGFITEVTQSGSG